MQQSSSTSLQHQHSSSSSSKDSSSSGHHSNNNNNPTNSTPLSLTKNNNNNAHQNSNNMQSNNNIINDNNNSDAFSVNSSPSSSCTSSLFCCTSSSSSGISFRTAVIVLAVSLMFVSVLSLLLTLISYSNKTIGQLADNVAKARAVLTAAEVEKNLNRTMDVVAAMRRASTNVIKNPLSSSSSSASSSIVVDNVSVARTFDIMTRNSLTLIPESGRVLFCRFADGSFFSSGSSETNGVSTVRFQIHRSNVTVQKETTSFGQEKGLQDVRQFLAATDNLTSIRPEPPIRPTSSTFVDGLFWHISKTLAEANQTEIDQLPSLIFFSRFEFDGGVTENLFSPVAEMGFDNSASGGAPLVSCGAFLQFRLLRAILGDNLVGGTEGRAFFVDRGGRIGAWSGGEAAVIRPLSETSNQLYENCFRSGMFSACLYNVSEYSPYSVMRPALEILSPDSPFSRETNNNNNNNIEKDFPTRSAVITDPLSPGNDFLVQAIKIRNSYSIFSFSVYYFVPADFYTRDVDRARNTAIIVAIVIVVVGVAFAFVTLTLAAKVVESLAARMHDPWRVHDMTAKEARETRERRRVFAEERRKHRREKMLAREQRRRNANAANTNNNNNNSSEIDQQASSSELYIIDNTDDEDAAIAEEEQERNRIGSGEAVGVGGDRYQAWECWPSWMKTLIEDFQNSEMWKYFDEVATLEAQFAVFRSHIEQLQGFTRWSQASVNNILRSIGGDRDDDDTDISDRSSLTSSTGSLPSSSHRVGAGGSSTSVNATAFGSSNNKNSAYQNNNISNSTNTNNDSSGLFSADGGLVDELDSAAAANHPKRIGTTSNSSDSSSTTLRGPPTALSGSNSRSRLNDDDFDSGHNSDSFKRTRTSLLASSPHDSHHRDGGSNNNVPTSQNMNNSRNNNSTIDLTNADSKEVSGGAHTNLMTPKRNTSDNDNDNKNNNTHDDEIAKMLAQTNLAASEVTEKAIVQLQERTKRNLEAIEAHHASENVQDLWEGLKKKYWDDAAEGKFISADDLLNKKPLALLASSSNNDDSTTTTSAAATHIDPASSHQTIQQQQQQENNNNSCSTTNLPAASDSSSVALMNNINNNNESPASATTKIRRKKVTFAPPTAQVDENVEETNDNNNDDDDNDDGTSKKNRSAKNSNKKTSLAIRKGATTDTSKSKSSQKSAGSPLAPRSSASTLLSSGPGLLNWEVFCCCCLHFNFTELIVDLAKRKEEVVTSIVHSSTSRCNNRAAPSSVKISTPTNNISPLNPSDCTNSMWSDHHALEAVYSSWKKSVNSTVSKVHDCIITSGTTLIEFDGDTILCCVRLKSQYQRSRILTRLLSGLVAILEETTPTLFERGNKKRFRFDGGGDRRAEETFARPTETRSHSSSKHSDSADTNQNNRHDQHQITQNNQTLNDDDDQDNNNNNSSRREDEKNAVVEDNNNHQKEVRFVIGCAVGPLRTTHSDLSSSYFGAKSNNNNDSTSRGSKSQTTLLGNDNNKRSDDSAAAIVDGSLARPVTFLGSAVPNSHKVATYLHNLAAYRKEYRKLVSCAASRRGGAPSAASSLSKRGPRFNDDDDGAKGHRSLGGEAVKNLPPSDTKSFTTIEDEFNGCGQHQQAQQQQSSSNGLFPIEPNHHNKNKKYAQKQSLRAEPAEEEENGLFAGDPTQLVSSSGSSRRPTNNSNNKRHNIDSELFLDFEEDDDNVIIGFANGSSASFIYEPDFVISHLLGALSIGDDFSWKKSHTEVVRVVPALCAGEHYYQNNNNNRHHHPVGVIHTEFC